MAKTLAALDAQVPGAALAGKDPIQRGRVPSRIFSNDDSDDSYESRISAASMRDDGSVASAATMTSLAMKRLVRFRGFSTSIQSLFLDESLVCASMGCFGLLLSQRTEFLLDVRNQHRGVMNRRSAAKSAHRHPSRFLAYALLVTIGLMVLTFFVWGFGSENSLEEVAVQVDDYDILEDDNRVYYQSNDDDGRFVNDDDDGGNNDDGNNGADDNNDDDNDDYWKYNNADDANQQNNGGGGGDDDDDGNNNRDRRVRETRSTAVALPTSHHRQGMSQKPGFTVGLCWEHAFVEHVWDPASVFLWDEWNRGQDRRQLEDNSQSDNDEVTTEQGDGSDDMNKSDSWDAATTTRLVIGSAFILLLGFVGRRRRLRTRYAIIKARAQEDHLYYASGSSAKVDSSEDNYEGSCAHTLLGCYPVDTYQDGDDDDDDDDDGNEDDVNSGTDSITGKTNTHRSDTKGSGEIITKGQDQAEDQQHPNALVDDRVDETASSNPNGKKHKHQDCLARLLRALSAVCCGTVCKCWCQFFSICALAQEAREMRLLVPQKYQRIDYITHQPFSEYQTSVVNLRRGWMGKSRRKTGLLPHFQALSRLSRYILILFTGTVTAIVFSLIFNPRTSFSFADGIVCAGTFLQSFLVLYVVHWIFHKSDLSLDAVIKLFAAGFVIGVPSAVFFEAVLMNVTSAFYLLTYNILAWQFGVNFEIWAGEHYYMLWVLYALVDAFFIAAVTEELCKYYTFRAVDHPDLLFLTGLTHEVEFDRAFGGGFADYAFGSHQVSNLNRTGSFGSVRSYRSNTSSASKTTGLMPSGSGGGAGHHVGISSVDDEPDVRTLRQRAAAVTTGMISVAVGLACAENFMYVFLLGGTGGSSNANGGSGGSGSGVDNRVMEEWVVLFFRSIFPVHALAGAMQAINMVRKFVECAADENDHRIGVGRIVMPAILLHGSFDAILYGINIYMESRWDQYKKENNGNVDDDAKPYNAALVNLLAWMSIILVMLLGILWFYRENRRQRQRLKLLEEQLKVEEDQHHPGIGAPPGIRSEMELV